MPSVGKLSPFLSRRIWTVSYTHLDVYKRQAKGLMKLYGEIAEREKKSARTVSRDIARAVEDLWECGDVKLLQKLLDRQMISGTSPGETIFLLANYLSGGKIRLK